MYAQLAFAVGYRLRPTDAELFLVERANHCALRRIGRIVSAFGAAKQVVALAHVHIVINQVGFHVADAHLTVPPDAVNDFAVHRDDGIVDNTLGDVVGELRIGVSLRVSLRCGGIAVLYTAVVALDVNHALVQVTDKRLFHFLALVFAALADHIFGLRPLLLADDAY